MISLRPIQSRFPAKSFNHLISDFTGKSWCVSGPGPYQIWATLFWRLSEPQLGDKKRHFASPGRIPLLILNLSLSWAMVLPPKYSYHLVSCHPLYVTYRENLNVQKGHGFHHSRHPMICIRSMWQLPPTHPKEKRCGSHQRAARLWRSWPGAAKLRKILGFSTGKPGRRQNTSKKLIGRSLGLCTTQKVYSLNLPWQQNLLQT